MQGLRYPAGNVHGVTGLIVDDTPHAGNFEPLAHLPKHKTVVLGLISSKVAELEDRKQIASTKPLKSSAIPKRNEFACPPNVDSPLTSKATTSVPLLTQMLMAGYGERC